MGSSNGTAVGIRELTDDEVAFYRTNGWAKLGGLISPTMIAELFARTTKMMGIEADATRHPGEGRGGGRENMWNSFARPSKDDEAFHDLVFSEQMGQLGCQLTGRPVRYWVDQILVKRPVGSEGGAAHTFWHLDLAGQPQDRSGQVQLWIALRDVPANRGALRFWTGSHRWPMHWDPYASLSVDEQMLAATGAEGKRLNDAGLPASYAELEARGEISPPLDLVAGDVTVHNSNILHSAPPNTTDEPRWAYTVSLIPADVCYTGQSSWIANGIAGLKVGQPFDVPEFPVIAPSSDWFVAR